MPITVPSIDDRRYADLLAEAIARIPVHTPEWTNFNHSDPGITLVELFAFLTESMLYRANLIPERNRSAFLSLLGIPLNAASSARGLVTISNDCGPLQASTVSSGLQVDAGEVPFRTEAGLDVLPVEGRVYYKRPVTLTPDLQDRYRQLYASFLIDGLPGEPPPDLQPYQTAVLDGRDPLGVDLVQGTVDGAIWVALLARVNESPDDARAALAGRVLSVGVVPVVTDVAVTLPPGVVDPAATGGAGSHLEYALPAVVPFGDDPASRVASYAAREAADTVNVLLHPGVVQLPLPPADGMQTWADLEPLEDGVGGFPPSVDDPALRARVVTWVRILARGVTQARILWAGINATTVSQRARILAELLPRGTGQPDQQVTLSHAPILPGSVRLAVSEPGSVASIRPWQEIADLLDAGPEVPVPDPALPPGVVQPPPAPSEVFAVDAEAGTLRFGDGMRGRRPPTDAVMRADYDYGLGRAGNVGPGAITTAAQLPHCYRVTNPVRTWGGADAEAVADGERQVARYLQHRDRLVSAADFDTITRRTPGVELARVDVLPGYDPQLAPNLPGDAPGTVTVMIVPRYDPAAPDAPSPDRFAMDAVCAYLEPRRLVTTELLLRGPAYVPVWVSVGIDVLPGLSIAEVKGRVTAELARVLSPLPLDQQLSTDAALPRPTYPHVDTGWPLRSPVTVVELAAYVTRVDGVHLVNGLLLGAGTDAAVDQVDMAGLQLPRLAAVSVTPGAPQPLAALRGSAAPAGGPPALPVPSFEQEC